MKRWMIGVMVASGMFAAAVAAEPIVVGGKNFTEQFLLAEMAALLLEDAGYEVDLRTGVGSSLARKSLINGAFDLYYEYSGTAYTVYYKKKDRSVMTDRERVLEWVRKHDAKKGLVWLDPLPFNNTYTLIMRRAEAEEKGIDTISALASHVQNHPQDLAFGMNSEFWERPDGFKRLMKTCGFRVPYGQIRKMSTGLVYKALRDGQLDVAMGFATDGRIAAFDFVTLEDDCDFFPVYNPAPVVREAALEQYGGIREALAPLAEHLDTETIRELNSEVDIHHRDERAVAREWMTKEGILP
ncbi:glycine betaine ABC transporter substrate-binding protein [Kiritimatiella glycovorans]|uniref:Osmoprotectant uptake system substrate-binding protein OsmF n=1 Tax=Kiritimatiella glycovorans TaxID=1307763 RepID=A0A0G3EGL9_9BACT|nr:glycine betaine ABC transporter substrate-binding protein [Kiritimatiella glycovorans]AKJ65493.1 Putative osmoprotectant uptake system substrate-binding protein OsmF precursor [Kiritimatiella glycovorans]